MPGFHTCRQFIFVTSSVIVLMSVNGETIGGKGGLGVGGDFFRLEQLLHRN